MLHMRTVLLVAALLLAITVPALAVGMNTTLVGTIGQLDLQADATLTGTTWTYTYVLTYTQSTIGGIVKTFQVESPAQTAFFNAANTDGFTDPVFNPAAWSIDWLNGNLAPGQTVTFSYQSVYQPDIIPVFALAVDSGQSAGGNTIGMGSTIPEPGSLMALAGMLAAGAGSLIRRRR